MTEQIRHNPRVQRFIETGCLVDAKETSKNPNSWIVSDMGRKGPAVAHDLQTTLNIIGQLQKDDIELIAPVIPEGLTIDYLYYLLNGLDDIQAEEMLSQMETNYGNALKQVEQKGGLLSTRANEVKIYYEGEEVTLEDALINYGEKLMNSILIESGLRTKVVYKPADELFRLQEYHDRVIDRKDLKQAVSNTKRGRNKNEHLSRLRKARKRIVKPMRLEGPIGTEIPQHSGAAMFRLLNRAADLDMGLAIQQLDGERSHDVLDALNWSDKPIHVLTTPNSKVLSTYNKSILTQK